MNSTKNWIKLADDLENLLQNKIGPEQFRTKYDFESLSFNTQTILAHVEHFLCDYDIRFKDPQYKKMQESEMEKLITLIRKSGPLEKILSIHFLGETEV